MLKFNEEKYIDALRVVSEQLALLTIEDEGDEDLLREYQADTYRDIDDEAFRAFKRLSK